MNNCTHYVFWVFIKKLQLIENIENIPVVEVIQSLNYEDVSEQSFSENCILNDWC